MIDSAEMLGEDGTIQAQGERCEGLTVFFVSLLASAGGSVFDEQTDAPALSGAPTREASRILQRLAQSPAANPSWPPPARTSHALPSSPAAQASWSTTRAPARTPRRSPSTWAGRTGLRWSRDGPVESRSGESTSGWEPSHAIRSWHGAPPLASPPRRASASLPRAAVCRRRATFPFADLLRETLRDAVQRPKTPYYNDVSLAISHTLHPLPRINPERGCRAPPQCRRSCTAFGGSLVSRRRDHRRSAWPGSCVPRAVLAMLLVTAYPITYALWLSLFRYDLCFPGEWAFVGLANYASVLTSGVWGDHPHQGMEDHALHGPAAACRLNVGSPGPDWTRRAWMGRVSGSASFG